MSERTALLAGKKGLVVGIANDRSIAAGCARAFRGAGAELAVTYLNDRARPYVEPLASTVGAKIVVPNAIKRGFERAFLLNIERRLCGISPGARCSFTNDINWRWRKMRTTVSAADVGNIRTEGEREDFSVA